jgi:hypothetical protein
MARLTYVIHRLGRVGSDAEDGRRVSAEPPSCQMIASALAVAGGRLEQLADAYLLGQQARSVVSGLERA